MSITRLEPPLWFYTPRGLARAFFLIDAGVDQDLMWVCFQHDEPWAGECWTYSNWDIRIVSNKTVGMITKSPWEGKNDSPRKTIRSNDEKRVAKPSHIKKTGASRRKPTEAGHHKPKSV